MYCQKRYLISALPLARYYVKSSITSACQNLSSQAQPTTSRYQQVTPLLSKEDEGHLFYNYTSGRWLYNEQIRLAERRLVFNVPALLQVVAKAVNKPLDSILSFCKIAEGGSYRVFEAIFSDGFSVIARLPYPCTVPQDFGIASEVFDWSSSATNAVGSAYIVMAKAEGQELERTWYTMDLQERMRLMEKIVDVEKKLFQIPLPANGSLYQASFLDHQGGVASVPLESASMNTDEFCVGPSAEYLWWYSGRDGLAVNSGPWQHSEEVMRSVGEREIAWLERFGKPRIPRDPLYKAFYDHQKVDPEVQKQSLRDYLKLVPLVIPEGDELNKPTIRHPDLSPNNIFVSTSGEITSLVDWQHTSILPLFLQAKVPKHFQNWGDDDSENLLPPRLPENFDDLTSDEQEAEMELYRKRQTHYFYIGYTNRNNESHFDAIGKAHLVSRNKLFDTAARPWEGDNTSLKAEIIKVSRNWPTIASSSRAKDISFPIQYTEEEITKCLDIDEKQQEADSQMQTLRDCFMANIDGWVSNDVYEQAVAREKMVRAQLAETAETEEDRKDFEDNWPFQDHEEVD